MLVRDTLYFVKITKLKTCVNYNEIKSCGFIRDVFQYILKGQKKWYVAL